MVNINSEKTESLKNSFKLKESMKILGKFIFTSLMILGVTGTIILSYVIFYVIGFYGDSIHYDMRAAKLHLTSMIYINDENNDPKEYDRVYKGENRIWVEFNDIPQYMKDAIIAIEDKRFMEHHGVDWVRTSGAFFSLMSSKNSYGGSTLTQQLIKNLTENNEVSIIRKAKEIFRALNFEKEYSKDEILEAYLNVVSFGSGQRGVESAANLYFGKKIKDCSLIECAAIAGITQNPVAYTPLLHPQKNKERRELVLYEMFSQGKISDQEYKSALDESSKMQFKSLDENNEVVSEPARNWYIDAMLEEIIHDLMEKLDIGRDAAQDILLTQGLKIYSAMDERAQNISQEIAIANNIMIDPKMELGYMMMDFDGRILASIGSHKEKSANFLFDHVHQAKRQPGSTIKPIASYAPAIDLGLYNFSSIVPDMPFPNFYGTNKPGPTSWYGTPKGNILLPRALEISANAAAAQVQAKLTSKKSYDFLVNKLGFVNLVADDISNVSALSIGGVHKGVTVREMTASFQIFGNGGIYNKPHMYLYIVDRNGKILLDNRDSVGQQAIKSTTATIMNRLLINVVSGGEGTGRGAAIPGWDIVGKTGTTDKDRDSWFIGESPYAVAGIWTGYDQSNGKEKEQDTSIAIRMWKAIMAKYLEGKEKKGFKLDKTIIEKYYSKSNGLIVDPELNSNSAKGYYTKDNMPKEDQAYIKKQA